VASQVVKTRAERSREWRRLNPELYKQRMRWYNVKGTYGIDEVEYRKMLDAQGGTCAICKSPDPGWKHEWFHIDHCHKTGKVRGLLCNGCNPGLGSFGDDPSRLRLAAEYLENHALHS